MWCCENCNDIIIICTAIIAKPYPSVLSYRLCLIMLQCPDVHAGKSPRLCTVEATKVDADSRDVSKSGGNVIEGEKTLYCCACPDIINLLYTFNLCF